MPRLETTVDRQSEAFRANRKGMLQAIGRMRELEAAVRANSERSRARFEARGQLLPRARLQRLLDRGTPFLEFSPLCAYKTFDDDDEANISGGRI